MSFLDLKSHANNVVDHGDFDTIASVTGVATLPPPGAGYVDLHGVSRLLSLTDRGQRS
jgi:hypothetical protein